MNVLEWNYYPAHRVAFYKGWLIMDARDGYYHLYQPDDDFKDEDVISDLDVITGWYECEWDASNLREAIDFIDGYGEE